MEDCQMDQTYSHNTAIVDSRRTTKSNQEDAKPRAAESPFVKALPSPGEAPSGPYPNVSDSEDTFRRFECKARSSGYEHNPDNAYIDVPLNASQGDLLYCSDEGCRASGKVFRWCTVCQVPAAKRNFHQRHSHDGIFTPRLEHDRTSHRKRGAKNNSRNKRKEHLSSDTTNKPEFCISLGGEDPLAKATDVLFDSEWAGDIEDIGDIDDIFSEDS